MKEDLGTKLEMDQRTLDGETWGITAMAIRRNQEEVFGLGFVPLDQPDVAPSTISFHHQHAVTWIRMLYSAFAALEDSANYLGQVGLAWTLDSRKAPTCANVGSVKDFGSAQIFADWSQSLRIARIVVYPASGPKAQLLLDIHGVADFIHMTTESFTALGWPIPD